MAQIANWNGHTFEVSAKLIRSFQDMALKGSCETEDKTSGGQKYVSRKNGNPAELTLNVSLSAYLGVTDVRYEALTYVKEANEGATEYFYLGTQKLVSAKMMLITAEVTEYMPMPGNADIWISCEVKLSFKQADKGDGSSGDDSGKKKKKKKRSNRTGGTGGTGNPASWFQRTANNVIQAGKIASACKLTSGAAGTKQAGGGTAAQQIFATNTKKGTISSQKKNPTTGRSIGGATSKVKAVRQTR